MNHLSKSALACALVLLLAGTAHGLIIVGKGNDPVKDSNWPTGSLDVANLKTRIGWWEGPPFGGGQHNFLYRGDTKAFQDALDLFAKIKSPELRVVVHPGPHTTPFLEDDKDPKVKARVDFSFTIWNPQNWHHLYNNPKSVFSAEDPSGAFRSRVEPPRMDVYIGGGGTIDFSKVKLPAGVTVSDKRASAAGIQGAGSVIIGDAYDIATSKPIADVQITVDRQGGQKHSAKGDVNGHFELKAIPTDGNRVWVSAPGYLPRVLGYEQFNDGTLKRYTTHLAKPVKISGTVTDAADKPVEGVKIRPHNVMGIDGRGYLLADGKEATTDAQGKFAVDGLPQGFLQIFAHKKGFQQQDGLAVLSAPADSIAIRMVGTGTVKGRVLGADGKPISPKPGDVSVSINPPGDPIGKWGGGTHVKPDGTFQFDGVPPGKYYLTTRPDGGDRAETNPNAKEIEVKTGQTTEVDIPHK